MEALKIKKHIDSNVLNLSIPETMIGKDIEIILLVESGNSKQKPSKPIRKPGSAKGMITMVDETEKAVNDEYQNVPSKRVVQRVQEIVRKYVAPDRSLSDEIVQDRRKESANE